MTGGGGSGSGSGGGSSVSTNPPDYKTENVMDEFFMIMNAREGRKWAYKNLGGKSAYPKNLAEAIGVYSGSMYEDINSAMRATNGDLSKLDDPNLIVKTRHGKVVNKAVVKGLVERMDKAFAMAASSPQTTKVTRGTTWHEFSSLGLTDGSDLSKYIGQKYQTRGFTSTSVDTEAAFSHKPVQMNITIPKGTKGVYMAGDVNYKDALSGIPDEEEWLMNRDAQWIITDAKLVNGKWVVEVVLVSS